MKLSYIEKNCQFCGGIMKKKKDWSIKQYNDSKYCDWSCFSKAQTYDFDKVKDEFLKRIIIKDNGCHEWTGARCEKGYGMYKYNGRTIRAHRFSWFLKTGSLLPDKIMACHKCDNPPCVNPEHLFIGTAQDNYNDMRNKGRAKNCKGENVSHSLLNNKSVLEIYNNNKLTQVELSRIYKVAPSTISAIKNGQNWLSVTGHKKCISKQ